MRYITLQQAAQRLNIAEEKLLQWAKDGYLNLYASKSTKSATPSAVAKYMRNDITYPTSPQLYCLADEIEELAEDLSWSMLGLQSLARDEDS